MEEAGSRCEVSAVEWLVVEVTLMVTSDQLIMMTVTVSALAMLRGPAAMCRTQLELSTGNFTVPRETN